MLAVGLPEDELQFSPGQWACQLEDGMVVFSRLRCNRPSGMSAGVSVDAIRCAKLALERGIGGPLRSASAYFMKHPPEQFNDDTADRMLEAFLAGERDR